jgi:hypothetical protein
MDQRGHKGLAASPARMAQWGLLAHRVRLAILAPLVLLAPRDKPALPEPEFKDPQGRMEIQDKRGPWGRLGRAGPVERQDHLGLQAPQVQTETRVQVVPREAQDQLDLAVR